MDSGDSSVGRIRVRYKEREVAEGRERLSFKLDTGDSRTCRRARRFRRNLYVAVFLRNLCRL